MRVIGAGIVLYNPEMTRLIDNVNALKKQVDFVLMVDNASDSIDEIERFFEKDKDVVIVRNIENVGVASALNQIIEYGAERKIEWMLTLDQDSVISPNLIENYRKFLDVERLAILTPRIIDRNDMSDEIKNCQGNEVEYVDVKRCITSASCFNVPICEKIGLFDQDMFIDWVDFEYCVRVMKANYRILRINTVTLIHQLGDLKVYHCLGRKIFVTNHSKERVYYYARNAIYYMKKHPDRVRKQDIFWELLKREMKIIFFEKHKWTKTFYGIQGIQDGMNLRMGKNRRNR
ncbi:MAG: glycosyltransferase family 2 protein [Tissierellales bacterium]|nr:glycosyltransferase family 2 protein [Tissierellales bacterium]MBN2828271.1 glycosyltransferase family 2 protein [Tissierellales bacterium]